MVNMTPNGGKKPDNWDPEIEHTREGPRPDFSKPLPPSKLPKELQATLDDDEKLLDLIYEGKAGESTDSSVRYAGYAARVRTIMMAAQRYVAYTSDIGESFRPIAHPNVIRGAYGISWAYIGGDVIHEGYKAYIQNQKVLYPEKYIDEKDEAAVAKIATGGEKKIPAIKDYRAIAAERAIFQSLASMGLPAFTIHSIVRYSGRALKNSKNVALRTWGPVGLGLAAVPALPYLFDEPVEKAVSWTFHTAFKAIGGPEAVGETSDPTKPLPKKQKEL